MTYFRKFENYFQICVSVFCHLLIIKKMANVTKFGGNDEKGNLKEIKIPFYFA